MKRGLAILAAFYAGGLIGFKVGLLIGEMRR